MKRFMKRKTKKQYPIRLVAHQIEKLPQRRVEDLRRFPKAKWNFRFSIIRSTYNVKL